VTDLGVYHFDEDGEMRLDSLHPGATLDDVNGAMGWPVRTAAELAVTPAPSEEELQLIRDVLDPEGRYTT
jgi:glutaconate CoA-transferase, subunit B